MPNPKIRDDRRGHGSFGDKRTNPDGSIREHKGVDLEALPGTPIKSPVDGTVRRIGDPYGPENRLHGQYKSITIRTEDGREVRMFYVAPTDAEGSQIINKGDKVSAGSVIGTLQDRAKASSGMKNHVHLEIRDKQGKAVDPAPWLNNWGVKNGSRRKD